MAEYRCYFLGPRTTSPFGVPSLVEAAENFTAGTDDEAVLIAEKAYTRRSNSTQSFELWQATRLVRRHAPSGAAMVGHKLTSEQNLADFQMREDQLLRRRVQKLRWLGLDDEADQLAAALQGSRAACAQGGNPETD